jgi:carboxymethylenebutenolidase
MRIELPSGTPAELVEVEGADRGLVVIPDIGGLRPLFDDHVARLAAETGWSVCAFELWPGREHLAIEERLSSVGTLRDDDLLADALAAADATGADPVVVLGFCMGGMYTLKAAGTGRFRRAVPFYGMIHIPEQWRSPTQGDPLAAATAPGACPVLAIVGTDDPWTPAEAVDELEAAGAHVVRYPGRDHGFVHDPSRPTHDAADAADAWSRALTFLAG